MCLRRRGDRNNLGECSMKSQVSYGRCILGSAYFAATAAGPGEDTPTGRLASGTSMEITVTAQRRFESMPKVPLSMQAFRRDTEDNSSLDASTIHQVFSEPVRRKNHGQRSERSLHARPERPVHSQQGSGSTGCGRTCATFLRQSIRVSSPIAI